MKILLGLLILITAACTQQTQSPTTEEGTSPPTSQPPTSTTRPSTTTSTAPTTTTSAITSTTTTAVVADLNILFVGNSHTSNHDVPAMVEALLESDPDRDVTVEEHSAAFLRSADEDTVITDAIASGQWDIVILQGQEISQSHSVAYSQEEAVGLAELAIASGSRPLMFSEWPRKNIDETAYIESIYDEIATKSGAEVIPVGRSWDLFLEDQPEASLWASDGNHSSKEGAFLAAATIAYFIAGPDAQLTTEPALAGLLEPARLTVEE